MSNPFSVSIDIITIFIFNSINIVHHIYRFVCVERSLYPKDKLNLIVVYDPVTKRSDQITVEEEREAI